MFHCTWQYVPPVSGESCSVSVIQSSIAGRGPKMVLGGTRAYSSGVGSSPNGATDAQRANTRDLWVFAVFCFWLSSENISSCWAVLLLTALTFMLWDSGISCYKVVVVTGDRATQECDPSTVTVPYGMGLASLLVPALYQYAGGFNAINSSFKQSRRQHQ